MTDYIIMQADLPLIIRFVDPCDGIEWVHNSQPGSVTQSRVLGGIGLRHPFSNHWLRDMSPKAAR